MLKKTSITTIENINKTTKWNTLLILLSPSMGSMVLISDKQVSGDKLNNLEYKIK